QAPRLEPAGPRGDRGRLAARARVGRGRRGGARTRDQGGPAPAARAQPGRPLPAALVPRYVQGFSGFEAEKLAFSSDFRYTGRAAGGALWSPASLWKKSDEDRKSTRLNSSHVEISYAVFCLKKKKKNKKKQETYRSNKQVHK